MGALRAFRDTILLCENVKLRWLLGGVDCMVSPHDESHDFFMTAAAFTRRKPYPMQSDKE
jgi:hypothetical protein